MTELDDCPEENEIVGFLEGALAEMDRSRIEAHCARCDRCREAYAHAADDAMPGATPGATTSAVGSPDDFAPSLKGEVESTMQGVLGDLAFAEDVVGKRIGRFEIVAVQGRGQFGVVYRARDTQLGRMVAVKVMRRTGRTERHDRSMREALLQTEAMAAARLQHPNIVTLHDHGEFEGAPYLVLELLEGETLRSRLEREARLAPLDALAIAGDVARALVEAHAAGVVHRDIKPGNVFLCASGQTKVLDFGLAQLQSSVDGAGPSGAATRAGTPRYMAPELFGGQVADTCSDVYAVGVMLLEALDGPASGRSSIEERIAAARLSSPLRRLVVKATAPERAARFQDAAALLAALERTRRRLAGSRLGRVGLATAAVLVAAAGVAILASRGAAPPDGAKPAVAVLGFDDLSGRGDTAWLATALSEMIDADIMASPAVHVVPPERVAHARADLGLVEGRRFQPRALQELRRYLGVDYVVLGAYVPVASEAGARMRFDIRIQDAWGVVLDSFSETTGDGELVELATRIASRLQVRLAGAALGDDNARDDARALRAAMPASAEAMQLYAEGLRQWRVGELIAARDILARAAAAEPGFALSHSALSQVLHQLGEEDRMRDEARLAFERSGGLRREDRLLIEARYREAIDQWPQARELRRMLHAWQPDDLDTGIELADALARHAEGDEALAVLAELRRLPAPWRDDPRIDLTEIWAQPRSSVRRALAISAASKARAVGDRWILARARAREATAERESGELDRAIAAAEDARALSEALGDREGRAIALYESATAREARGDPKSAVIAAYEQALQIEREIGNRDQVANMLGNVAFAHLMAGNPAEAAPRLDEMERLARGKARFFAAQNRGIQWLEQGELARAFAQLEQIRQSGKMRGFELKLLGDVLTDQGELAAARERLDQFLARDWSPDDSLRLSGALAMARLELEDGEPAGAEARARETLSICERTHNRLDVGTAQAMLARALVVEHRFDEAKAAAETALGLADRIEIAPEWIDARLALARARFGLHPDDADAALADARMALERARARGLVGRAYDARLAAAEIAAQAGRPAAGAQLRALAEDAEQHGFGLIARKARAATARAR